MDKLYPIVRRVRRPLLPEDEPALKAVTLPVSTAVAEKAADSPLSPPVTIKEADAAIPTSNPAAE